MPARVHAGMSFMSGLHVKGLLIRSLFYAGFNYVTKFLTFLVFLFPDKNYTNKHTCIWIA